jgi:hypothetical protein
MFLLKTSIVKLLSFLCSYLLRYLWTQRYNNITNCLQKETILCGNYIFWWTTWATNSIFLKAEKYVCASLYRQS